MICRNGIKKEGNRDRMVCAACFPIYDGVVVMIIIEILPHIVNYFDWVLCAGVID